MRLGSFVLARGRLFRKICRQPDLLPAQLRPPWRSVDAGPALTLTAQLTKREQAQCAVLAMPDSNTGLMGDSVFTFRMRR